MGDRMGLTGVLFVVFLVLKLTDYIDWSWWWIFAPIWLPLVFLLFIFAGYYIFTSKQDRQFSRAMDSLRDKLARHD